MPAVTALGFDATLCFAFFFHHSGMVRKSFQRKAGAVIPEHYFGIEPGARADISDTLIQH